MKKLALFFTVSFVILLVSYKQQADVESVESIPVITRHEPITISYHLENTKQWLSAHDDDTKMLRIAYAANRTYVTNLKQLDSILLPTDGYEWRH
jgi:hypothetical protein